MNELEIDFEWFLNVGDPKSATRIVRDFFQVLDWQSAVDALTQGGKWDDVQMDERNELSLYLNNRCHSEFQKWNFVISEAKVKYEAAFEKLKTYLMKNNLSDAILASCQWDTVNAYAANYFLEWNPPRFYLHLFEIYRAGHFPCGWNGDWPKGKLIVF